MAVGFSLESWLRSCSLPRLRLRANSRFHNKSFMEGRSAPESDKHFSAVSTNFFKLSGFIFPLMWGSIISSSVPFCLQSNAHSARLTCSLGRLGFRTGLAQRASKRTTPNEYTSDFSVNCCLLKYSGSK